MRHVILYRDPDFRDELPFAKNDFFCTAIRPQIQKGDFVIGRYSIFPFYYELYRDLNFVGAKLINSYNQHLYIAEMENYVSDLKEMTPETWKNLSDLPDEGPFILKGAINSKKYKWDSMMYAKDKKAAGEVYSKLSEDGLIGYQQIYIRKYIPLITYANAIGGLPITKEFRFFVAFGEILCGDYYWSNFRGEFPKPDVSEVPKEFLDEAIKRIGDKVNFYAMDVAQTQAGDWIVIELNDAQYSGTSENDLKTLYLRLKEVLNKKFPEDKL